MPDFVGLFCTLRTLSDYVGLCRTLSDFQILSDFVGLVGFCRTLSDFVGLCRIRLLEGAFFLDKKSLEFASIAYGNRERWYLAGGSGQSAEKKC